MSFEPAGTSPSPTLQELLAELVRLAGTVAVMHDQYQGLAMSDATYEQFSTLRDERIPALKKQIEALATIEPTARGPLPVAQSIALKIEWHEPSNTWRGIVLKPGEDQKKGAQLDSTQKSSSLPPTNKALAYARLQGEIATKERDAREAAKSKWLAEPDDSSLLEAYDRGWADRALLGLSAASAGA